MRGAPVLILVLFSLVSASTAAPPSVLDVAVESPATVGELVDVRVTGADGPVRVALVPVAARAVEPAPALPLNGPHVHAPRPGWNDVHVESEEAPTVRVRHADSTAPRVALARAAERLDGGGWRVPVLLPWAGNWSLDVTAGGDAWALALFVPEGGLDNLVRPPRREGVSDPVLVAREPAVLVEGATRVRFTVLYLDEATGEWRPPGPGARASAAAQRPGDDAYFFEAPLARSDSFTFEAVLDVPSGVVDVRVNVTDEALPRASVSLTTFGWAPGTGVARAAAVEAGAWRARVVVPAAGEVLAVAHAPGAHGEARLTTRAPAGTWALLEPYFLPAAGPVEARLTLRDASGTVLPPPAGGVTATLLPGDRPLALEPDGNGYRLALDLPAGTFRVRVRGESVDASAELIVASGPGVDVVGEGGTPARAPRPVAPLVAAGVGAAALAGLAWALYRGGRMRGGRP